MALWKFTHLNKYGNYKTRITHTEGSLKIPGGAFGKKILVNKFKYKYEHPILPPTIWENQGKTYLMPLWKEVIKGTTLEDIEWIKPKEKTKLVESIKKTWKFESKSEPGSFYIVTQISDFKVKCNCPGFYRAKDRTKGCKHVQEIRSGQ